MEETKETNGMSGMPAFDPAKIREMTDEQLDEYGKEYTAAVTDFVKESVAAQLVPVMRELEQKQAEQEFRSAVCEMKENEDYYDFTEKFEQVKALCDSLPSLGSMDARSALTMGYLMVKGAQAVGEHKKPAVQSAQELADQIYENAEVMKLLNERRAKDAADAELPVFAKSASGAAGVKKKPQTLSDARDEARKYFKI